MSLNDDLRKIFRLLAQLDRPRAAHAGDKPTLGATPPGEPSSSDDEPPQPELRFRPLASARAGPLEAPKSEDSGGDAPSTSGGGRSGQREHAPPRGSPPPDAATAAFTAAAERIVRRYLRRPASGRRKPVRGGLAHCAAVELAREAERIFRAGDRGRAE